MAEETQQSLWNFDGAELYEIFGIKQQIIHELHKWDLESAYWSIRSLRREIDAKLKRKQKKIIEEAEKEKNKGKVMKTEKEEIDDLITYLDNARSNYNSSKKIDSNKTEFYMALEKVYMELCFIMKKHGLYFREGEDVRLAVLRR